MRRVGAVVAAGVVVLAACGGAPSGGVPSGGVESAPGDGAAEPAVSPELGTEPAGTTVAVGANPAGRGGVRGGVWAVARPGRAPWAVSRERRAVGREP